MPEKKQRQSTIYEMPQKKEKNCELEGSKKRKFKKKNHEDHENGIKGTKY